MATVRLTDKVNDYLKSIATESESVDAVIRSLIGFEPSTDRRVINKQSIMPRERIIKCILQFESLDGSTAHVLRTTGQLLALAKRDLDTEWFRHKYPNDFEYVGRQIRWKARFYSALQYLESQRIVFFHRSGEWKGYWELLQLDTRAKSQLKIKRYKRRR